MWSIEYYWNGVVVVSDFFAGLVRKLRNLEKLGCVSCHLKCWSCGSVHQALRNPILSFDWDHLKLLTFFCSCLFQDPSFFSFSAFSFFFFFQFLELFLRFIFILLIYSDWNGVVSHVCKRLGRRLRTIEKFNFMNHIREF